MDITGLIPGPVSVRLAGKEWLAGELTLADYAELQAWANSLRPSPFDEAAFDLLVGSGPEWKRLLSDVIDAQEEWRPDLDELLRTDEGRAKVIHLSLRKYHPDLTAEDARLIVEDAACFEATFLVDYMRFSRVAWGSDPEDTIRALIDGPPDDAGERTEWGKVYYKYVRECRNGPSFQDLTMRQLRAFLREGKGVDEGRSDMAAVAEKRKEFWTDINGEVE